jgi:hypothetical protein
VTPTTPDDIRALQAKRFAYLKFVYDDAQQRAGGGLQTLETERVRAHLGVDTDEAERIEQYLTGRHLLEYVAMGPLIAITTYGVDYVEQALAAPDRDTEFFPAINVLHIEQAINSQIQQGTANSQQTGDWNGLSAAEVLSIAAEIRSALSSIPLPAERRDDAEAHVATLEAQGRARRPNQAIVREALRSLRAIAEQVGAAVIAGKMGVWLLSIGAAAGG